MEITAKIRIPEQIYRFYADASQCVRDKSTEDILADALSAYARILSGNIPADLPTVEDEKVF